MLVYVSFEDGVRRTPRDYQTRAYNEAEKRSSAFFTKFDGFQLQRNAKFPQTYLIIRDNKTLSGILTTQNIKVRSTVHKTAADGCVAIDNIHSLPSMVAEYDYCIEYAGNVVNIKKGELVYLTDNKITIGWHGSYSPPHGQ